MSTEDDPKPFKVTQEEFDAKMNRIQLALAKHENIVKSWRTPAFFQEPTKTDEQLDAEDAVLFRNEPPYLGVGAPIPSEFLISDAERNNKSLRAKLFPTKGLKGSKPRDSEEKATSAKRALNAESSDEEGGRSSLGKAKKKKAKIAKDDPTPIADVKSETKQKANEDNDKTIKGEQLDSMKATIAGTTLATPPRTPEKIASPTTIIEQITKHVTHIGEPRPITDQIEGTTQKRQKEEEATAKPMSREMRLEASKQRHKLKKKMKKRQASIRKREELTVAKVSIETEGSSRTF